ncbi:conserved hypothetical protein [Ricinus communis]|uniref:Uncharacterized protein n=1 Tax=Ricinus communis TaxID=3988 RepID=B9RPJ3_RICCO|nr:conserved hypothetical protein [Ricinus communis]
MRLRVSQGQGQGVGVGDCKSKNDSEAESVELVATDEDNNEGSDVDDELRAVMEAVEESLKRKRRKKAEDGFVKVLLEKASATANVRTASVSCKSEQVPTPNLLMKGEVSNGGVIESAISTGRVSNRRGRARGFGKGSLGSGRDPTISNASQP